MQIRNFKKKIFITKYNIDINITKIIPTTTTSPAPTTSPSPTTPTCSEHEILSILQLLSFSFLFHFLPFSFVKFKVREFFDSVTWINPIN